MTRRTVQELTTRPMVSVVIPCYNYGHFLTAAVESAFAQDGVDVDVVIVDDASQDSSVEVARRLARDPRVRLVEHADNQRHIATYNDGLAEIKGDYVVLLSADDLLPRNALTRAVAVMEAHPSVGLVYGFPQSFDSIPDDGPAHVRSWSVWSGRDWMSRVCRTSRNPIMSPEAVLRRAAWDEIGEYDTRLPHAADMATWLNVALRWDVARVNGPVQAHYRVHGANMHLTTYAGMLTDLEQRALVFDLLFAEGHPLPPGADRLHARARRALGRTALEIAGGSGVGADVELTPSQRDDLRDLARRLGARGRPRRGPLAGFTHRVEHHLAWRRWHRFGT